MSVFSNLCSSTKIPSKTGGICSGVGVKQLSKLFRRGFAIHCEGSTFSINLESNHAMLQRWGGGSSVMGRRIQRFGCKERERCLLCVSDVRGWRSNLSCSLRLLHLNSFGINCVSVAGCVMANIIDHLGTLRKNTKFPARSSARITKKMRWVN